MGIRRRRRKLTTLMSRLDDRMKAVELRPISLLTQSQVSAAVDAGAAETPPAAYVGPDAPARFIKIESAYVYPKGIPNSKLTEDRVEIFLESTLGVSKDGILEIHGIHGTSTQAIDVDGKSFKVLSTDKAPWTDRPSYAQSPTSGQRTGVTISNTYTFKPDTVAPKTWVSKKTLITKVAISTYAISGSTVTLALATTHKFEVGDILYVDIFAADSRAYGVDGLIKVTAVTSSSITYILDAGVDTPIAATAPETTMYVFPVARQYLAIGSTWADTANNILYYWDGMRWVDYSKVATPVRDGDPPAAPTGLTFANDNVEFYGKDSLPVATFTVSWTAPDKTKAGKALNDLVGYTLKWRKSTSDPWTSTDIRGGDTSYKFSGSDLLEQSTVYYIAVIAYDSGLQDSTALTGSHTTRTGPVSTLTGVRPTPLSATSYMGTITLTWNGKFENSFGVLQPNPPGVSMLYVYASITSASFTPVADNLIGVISAISGAKLVFADNITYGTSYYFKARIMDASGQSSAFSAATTAKAESLVDANAIAGVIAAANITPGTMVVGDKITGMTITGKLVQGSEIHGDLIKANTIEADRIVAGVITSKIVQGDVISSKISQTGARVTMDANGLYGYNTSGNLTFRIRADNGDVYIANGVQIGGYATQASLDAVDTKATNAASGATSAYNKAVIAEEKAIAGQDATTAIKSRFFYGGVTEINGGTIRTDTITAVQIAASYVYAGAISATQISAGTLTGRTIRTAASGTRVQMDASTDSLRFFYGATEIGTIYPGASGYGLTVDNNATERLSLYPNHAALIGNNVAVHLYAAATRSSARVVIDANRLDILDWGGTDYGIGYSTAAGLTFAHRLNHTSSTNKAIYVAANGLLTPISSDERIKQNIVDLPLGLEFVSKLQPKQYQFKYTPDVTEYGLLAQQVRALLEEYNSPAVESIVPIDESDWGKAHLPEGETEPLLGMEYMRLIPILINSIKELKAKVDELENGTK